MDLSHPIASVIPSAHGAVLAVLARSGQPLTGRTVASLTAGQVSSTRTKGVLADLATAGIVTCEPAPPANLYALNPDHVAYDAIMALSSLSEHLHKRMADAVGEWELPPTAVWLFGSGARQDGTPHSDLDVLVVRPDAVDADDHIWNKQVGGLSASASAWSGNDCRILELSDSEIIDWTARDERLIRDLRVDAVALWGAHPTALLKAPTRVKRKATA
jgi:hypothetical protein